MVAQLVASIKEATSSIRLESYRPAHGSDLDMITNYVWDMELAKQLMPLLHAVEIALRNSIHAALTMRYNDTMWFFRPLLLDSGQVNQLSQALGQLARRRTSITADLLVAELTFGFWVTLVSDPYEQKLWQPTGFQLLKEVFPNATGRSRKEIHKRYNEIRLGLRNRVSHYEAIWDLRQLPQRHVDLLEAIAWINQPLHDLVAQLDLFPQSASLTTVAGMPLQGRPKIEAAIKQHLGIA